MYTLTHICLWSSFIYDSNRHIYFTCKFSCSCYRAKVRRNNNKVVVVELFFGEFIQIVFYKSGIAQQMVNGDVKETLNLGGMQVHGQNTICTGSGKHVCNKLGAD